VYLNPINFICCAILCLLLAYAVKLFFEGPVAPEDTWAEMRDASEELAVRRSRNPRLFAMVD
jgi:hypothetical protein